MACQHDVDRNPYCGACGLKLRERSTLEVLWWDVAVPYANLLRRLPRMVACGYGLHKGKGAFCPNCGVRRGV